MNRRIDIVVDHMRRPVAEDHVAAADVGAAESEIQYQGVLRRDQIIGLEDNPRVGVAIRVPSPARSTCSGCRSGAGTSCIFPASPLLAGQIRVTGAVADVADLDLAPDADDAVHSLRPGRPVRVIRIHAGFDIPRTGEIQRTPTLLIMIAPVRSVVGPRVDLDQAVSTLIYPL